MVQIIDTLILSADENMRYDAELLDNLREGDGPLLHIYQWKKPSVTYGYFVKPEQFLNLQELENQGIECARRPTGGGIIFHIWDLSFGILIPNGHEGYSNKALDNYQYINRMVQEAVQKVIQEEGIGLLPIDPTHEKASVKHFCMAKPTIYDVMLGGLKIAGAAQRKKPQGFLHQGSISLAMPDFGLLDKVVIDPAVTEAMRVNTFALFEEMKEPVHQRMSDALKQVLVCHLSINKQVGMIASQFRLN